MILPNARLSVTCAGARPAVRTFIEATLDNWVTGGSIDLQCANRLKAMLIELASALPDDSGVAVRLVVANDARKQAHLDLSPIQLV